MRFHVVPARSFQFFVSLWNSFNSDGKLKLLLAEYPGNSGPVLLAGTIFLYFKETATYAFNGSSRKDFSIRPNDLLIWTAIHDANENGYKYFDMGEAAEGNTGLVQFKKKWTDTEIQLYHYYYPSLPGVNGKMIEHESSNSSLKNIWQFIPLPLTALLGERINKHL